MAAPELLEIWRGDPVITAYASTAISAGDFACATGGVVSMVTSAGKSSYAASDVMICTNIGNLYQQIIGMAAGDADAAGTYVPVITRGMLILQASNAIVAGRKVTGASASSVCIESTAGVNSIGRALMPSAAGGYFLCLFDVS